MDWMLIAILVVAGLVLLVLEVYVPGFVVGSLGVAVMLAAVFVAHRAYGLTGSLTVLAIEMVAGLAAVVVALKYFPQTRTGRKMILATTESAARAQSQRGKELIGREGVAESLLRPTGVALVDGKRLDVVAESGIIERGSPVRVVAVEENRIVVRKI
jgi:membrane-bound serine protease (ClpP class)